MFIDSKITKMVIGASFLYAAGRSSKPTGFDDEV
jgi:hypothetical protein